MLVVEPRDAAASVQVIVVVVVEDVVEDVEGIAVANRYEKKKVDGFLLVGGHLLRCLHREERFFCKSQVI
jgi:hypothetical protein